MTILGALLRNIEFPATPLTSTALAEWLTGGARTKAGVSVTEKKVYGLPAYYRAIALTAGALAGLPFKVYVEGTRQRVRQRTVVDNPSPRQTPLEFWFTMFANALSWGEGFSFKVRDGAGIVRQQWPIHPSRVKVYETDPTADDPAGKTFRVTFPDGTQAKYTGWDVFHLPYLSLDGVAAIRPLELFRESLGIALAAEQVAGNLFGNGSMISGVLSTDQPLKQDQADVLKARWKSRVAGPHNAGDIAVLDRGTKFSAIALPPGDAQLLESRKWSVTEIARMIGVPPFAIGDIEKSTSWGTGIEQQVLTWLKFGLGTWVELRDQRVTREWLPGGWDQNTWYAEASVEGLLRGDSKSRAEFYRILTSIGAMKLTRVQELENWEPDPTVDFYTIPKNQLIVRPGDQGDEGAEGEKRLDVLDLTQAMQRIYLAVVNKVITVDEARDVLNRAGADLAALPALEGSSDDQDEA